MKRRWLVCSVVLLSLVLVLPASTQTKTVLTNGDFEVAIGSEWTADQGTLTRTTSPVHGGSNAAQLTPSMAGAGSASQCINLSPHLGTWPAPGGIKYLTYNGHLYSNATTPVYLEYELFAATDCTGTSHGVGNTSFTTAASWQLHTITAAIPEGAQSVKVAFTTFGSAAPIYADDLAVFSSTATAVQTQGMAARNSLWAVGLVGVAAVGVVLGRRKKS